MGSIGIWNRILAVWIYFYMHLFHSLYIFTSVINHISIRIDPIQIRIAVQMNKIVSWERPTLNFIWIYIRIILLHYLIYCEIEFTWVIKEPTAISKVLLFHKFEVWGNWSCLSNPPIWVVESPVAYTHLKLQSPKIGRVYQWIGTWILRVG